MLIGRNHISEMNNEHVHHQSEHVENHIHEHDSHVTEEAHHHHTHTITSVHTHGHHLLQVEHLSIGFNMYDSQARFFSAKRIESHIIDDLSISVHEGEIVAIVGASGSGKTLLADAILGRFEPNAIMHGSIWFDGALVDEHALRHLRNKKGGIAFVPQGVAHLDPLMKVGTWLEHSSYFPDQSREDVRARRKELFHRYKLDESVCALYPFELSGGMARRVLLIAALMQDPKLIIADEPTPGLDFELAKAAMQDFQDVARAGNGVLFITHDIQLALAVADRIAIFNEGTIVEETSVESFSDAACLRHPYARALFYAMPQHGMHLVQADKAE